MAQKMKEKVRVHQIIPAPPGTRVLIRITEEDGTYTWEPQPLLLLALVEDLEDGGDRFVVPMDQWNDGVLTHAYELDYVGRVLAPGEPVPPPEQLG